MKKGILIVLLALLSVLGLVGCSENKPEQAVIELFDAMKNTDMEKLGIILDGESSQITDQDAFVELIKKSNETLTYNIGEVAITDDKATVDVDCTYGDIKPIFGTAFTGYIGKVFELAFSGTSPSEEEVNTILADEIALAIESTSPEVYSTKVQVKCIKVDGKWVIDSSVDNIELADVLTGNLVSAFSEMAESMNAPIQDE